MTDHDSQVQHRSQHTAPADTIRVRECRAEAADGDADQFVVRMPITSTAEARDGEAFTEERVRGFRDQIADGGMGIFIDHGRNSSTGHRYSALGKVGRLAEPELVEREQATDLDADFRFPVPDAVDAGAETLREVLATLYSQAQAGIPLTSSIGWREDTGERDVPGDAEMLEVSVVGIPSDPRTTTASAEAAPLARAVSAATSDFDVDTFVRELRRERAEYEVGDETVTIDPPDAVVNAATVALAKDDELEPDCGTGAGRESARAIADDDVGPERIDDIAAYLTSHEEDVTADGPPTDWSDEEWSDCGNLQYALWGGTGTGTGLEWAQRTANAVADAKDEERPYPERAATDISIETAFIDDGPGIDDLVARHGVAAVTDALRDWADWADRNLDDPAFGEGDAVEWSSNDATVRGRVADIGAEFTVGGGDVTITGDEGEAVYLLHELDDSLEPPQYRRENVAKPESSLDESQADLPPLEGNFADDDEANTMSESSEPDGESGADSEESTARMEGMEEQMADMHERVVRMDERMGEMHEEMMGGDGDDEDDDEGGEEENAADAADADDERTVTLDGEETPVDEALEDLRALREEASEAEPGASQTTERAESDEDEETDTETAGFGFAGLEEA